MRVGSAPGYHPFMRIMHLEFGRHLYGGARQVCYLIEGLDAEGVENVLVCARGSEIADAMDAGEVEALPTGGDLDLRVAGPLRKLIARHAPAIVHVHSRRGADTVGGWCAHRAGVPAVLTRRVDTREPALWARLKYKPYRVVVAISSAVESELVNHVGLDPARVVKVASAVDAAGYVPAAAAAARERLAAIFGLPGEPILVGVIAQLIPRKGHELLLGSLREIFAHHPQVRVLCFGRGRLRQALQREIDNRGFGTRVKLAGFRNDLADLIPGLHLLVHPARREGLGVAVLEALSAGVPVVASDAGGLTDIIEQERHGLLFESGNARALRDAVMRMLDDSELRRRCARNGRMHVESEFSVQRMSRRYLEVYNRVLSTEP